MLCGINFQAYIKNFVPKKVYTIENIIAIRGRVPLYIISERMLHRAIIVLGDNTKTCAYLWDYKILGMVEGVFMPRCHMFQVTC